MERLMKHQLFLRKKERFHFSILLAGAIAALFLIITIILSNTYQLEQQLRNFAESYSADVSDQLAERIRSRLLEKVSEIQNMADSFSKLPDDVFTKEFFEQKKALLQAEHLFMVKQNGDFFPQQDEIKGLQDYLDNEKGIENETHISFLEKNSIILSTPFSRNEELYLLVSISTGAPLQDMINDFNYKDKGRCCLVNKKGKLVIAPSDMQPFYELEAVFHTEALAEKHAETISLMHENINQGKSGWAVFKNSSGHDLIVGYDILGVCNWILLTILPQNIFIDAVRDYTVKFILIAFALIVVTVYIVLFIVRVYKKNMQHIRKAALTDPLTQGDNDTSFRLRGEYLLKSLPNRKYALIYLNNKDFKNYNSHFGVDEANKILNDIHQLLRRSLKNHELVARCDGTSFYLLLSCENEAVIMERAEHICSTIKEHLYCHYHIDEHHIVQGAFLIPSNTYDFIQMQDWAKIASSYNDDGKACKIFDDSIAKILMREQELDDSFDKAIADHEFKLYIQPKVSPKNPTIICGEVLVRWEHHKYGLIPPNDFIPLFERNGKICRLDLYMFEETCKLLHQWLKEEKVIPLSVNLSRMHLNSHDFEFLKQFHELKEQYQIPDGLIELELTESIVLNQEDVPFALQVMKEIQRLGFLCSLDDFGFGYSSLTLLKDLDVNTIKLDRQFFLNETKKAWIVIKNLIQMAHELKISVVAEGIEEWKQVETLRTYDCDLIQGYVFAKPMNIKMFTEWLKEKRLK